jgi:hypothetical protein
MYETGAIEVGTCGRLVEAPGAVAYSPLGAPGAPPLAVAPLQVRCRSLCACGHRIERVRHGSCDMTRPPAMRPPRLMCSCWRQTFRTDAATRSSYWSAGGASARRLSRCSPSPSPSHSRVAVGGPDEPARPIRHCISRVPRSRRPAVTAPENRVTRDSHQPDHRLGRMSRVRADALLGAPRSCGGLIAADRRCSWPT